jgi:elongation factor P hydroxylase
MNRGNDPLTKALEQAQHLAANHCWQAVLWWTIEALEIDPEHAEARELFNQGVKRVFAAMVKRIRLNEEGHATYRQRLQQRGMSQAKAETIADWMISVNYAEKLRRFGYFLKRFNRGEIQQSKQIEAKDLKAAREFVLALGDENLPGQRMVIQWRSLLGEPSQQYLDEQIDKHRQTLLILLRTNTPADWPDTCQRISDLWENDPGERAKQLVKNIQSVARDRMGAAEFRQHRDDFEGFFSRNAAELVWVRNLSREITRCV